MESKHTPGPWETSAGHDPGCQSGCRWEIIDGADSVATISDRPEAKGNARLIAEAPAMLEVLRELVAGNYGQPCGVTVPALDPARALLARIEGS